MRFMPWRGPARLAACGLVLTAAAGCGARGEKAVEVEKGPRVVPITVAEIRTLAVERTRPMVGTLKGWEHVTVGVKRPGRVVKIFHDMGDRIRPGEPLVELERVDAELAVAQAQRQLQAELAKLGLAELPGKDQKFDPASVPAVVQAHVAVDRARRNLNIQRGLIRQNAGIPQDLSNAENDLSAAEAALEKEIVTARSTLANAMALKVALEVAKQRQADLVVLAPVPSRSTGLKDEVTYAVTKRTVAEGQMLKEGEAVFDLVVENPLRLWADVPGRFSPEIAVGQDVRLSVDAHPGRTFAGKVARINPSVDERKRAIQVETLVPNSDGLLRPGSFAKGEIITRRDATATVVPVESVVRFAGVTKIFVVEGDSPQSTARAVEVQTGLDGPGWIEVTGKVPSRGRVVTTGQTQLADGTAVLVRGTEPRTAQVAGGE